MGFLLEYYSVKGENFLNIKEQIKLYSKEIENSLLFSGHTQILRKIFGILNGSFELEMNLNVQNPF